MRKILRPAGFTLALLACGLLLQAQENNENKKKPKSTAEPEQHQQRQAAPQQQAPRAQQPAPQSAPATAPPERHSPPMRNPAPVQQPVRNEQAQPTTPRSNNPQQRENIQQGAPQPGFGANPGRVQPQPGSQPSRENQPGRTYGTSPVYRSTDPRPGNDARPAPAPRTVTTRTGDIVRRDSGGQIRQVQMNNGSVVYHPPNAPRRVEIVRPGGRTVVASAPGHGYVQRSVVVRNTTVIKRTYVYQGVPQARFYRPRSYNGVTLAIYTPVRYYRPAYYAYVYNPWPRPVYYSWGWNASPWYGYYGGYFTPYPVYASPSLWLTDYLIAATLESAYQERMAARSMQAGSMPDYGDQAQPMSPEVKQAIADEVRRQIDRERSEGQTANNSYAPDSTIFSDTASHVFVVNATYSANSGAGECTIREGDVLQMRGATASNAIEAEVMVLSSRGPDCRKGSIVSVGLRDLQEMHNEMLATIDRGLGDMQSKQGQSGLPPLPQGVAGTVDTALAQEAQPDSGAINDLNTVNQEADRAEQQALAQTSDGTGVPPTLSAGLTIEEVRAIQGEPQKIVDLGSKKIYLYRDLKITFIDGKVTDIE